MIAFLDRLARLILEHHSHELEHVAVVLPGKRAGIHLRKYLAQAAGTTIWSPELLDMGSFLERLSGMRQGSSMEMLFMLYSAHREQAGDNASEFAELLQWGPVALRDMSEVDSHLIEHATLYRDLRAYHEIDAWSFRLGPISPGQERMLHAWHAAGELHRIMARRMMEAAVGTSGAIARRAAELASKDTLSHPWKAIWFAGLNALEPAHTAVVGHLQGKGIVHLAWDTDQYYLDDARQEAGSFLRRSIEALGAGEIAPGNGIMDRQRELVAVAVPNPIAQLTYAADRLAELTPDERASTVVVLADEQLLMPLLDALPEDIGPLNVTMGLPLEALPVHGLVNAFLALHTSAKAGDTFHHTAVERLLMHPFLHEGDATRNALEALRATQLTFISASRILQHARQAAMLVPDAMRTALAPISEIATELQASCNALLAWAKAVRVDDRYVQEQLFRMARLQVKLHSGLRAAGLPVKDLTTYSLIRDRLLREEQLSFLGEPLQGLQIMGILETRALDHERVILLGANEGNLPKASADQSWIPFDLRRIHRLPLHGDREAIAAYHFNRMAHHAKELVVVYDAGGSGAEPTRFLAQWEQEVVGRSATRSTRQTRTAALPTRHSPTIEVVKDSGVQRAIDDLLGRGLSPSALGTWMRCPLDLYFKYLLRLRPPEEVDEKLGSDVLGEAVHHVLESIYRECLGAMVDAAHLIARARAVKDDLIRHLAHRTPLETLERGHFRLRIEMAAEAIRTYLHAEAGRSEHCKTIPLALELDLAFPLSPGVMLRGRCDRIEDRDGVTHVLDLKTGSVKPGDLRLPGLEPGTIGPEHRFAMQLLVYAWTYLQMHPEVPLVRAGIIPLQRPSLSEGLLLEIGGSVDIARGMLPDIAALLGSIVDAMRDTTTGFRHDPDSLYCTCCLH